MKDHIFKNTQTNVYHKLSIENPDDLSYRTTSPAGFGKFMKINQRHQHSNLSQQFSQSNYQSTYHPKTETDFTDQNHKTLKTELLDHRTTKSNKQFHNAKRQSSTKLEQQTSQISQVNQFKSCDSDEDQNNQIIFRKTQPIKNHKPIRDFYKKYLDKQKVYRKKIPLFVTKNGQINKQTDQVDCDVFCQKMKEMKANKEKMKSDNRPTATMYLKSFTEPIKEQNQKEKNSSLHKYEVLKLMGMKSRKDSQPISIEQNQQLNHNSSVEMSVYSPTSKKSNFRSSYVNNVYQKMQRVQQFQASQNKNIVYPKLYGSVEIKDLKMIANELFYYVNFMKNIYGNGIKLFKVIENIRGFTKFVQKILFELIESNINYKDFVDYNQVVEQLRKYYLKKNKWFMKKQKIINQSVVGHNQQILSDKQVLDFLVNTGKIKQMIKFLEEIKQFIYNQINCQNEKKYLSGFSKKLLNYQQHLSYFKMKQLQNTTKTQLLGSQFDQMNPEILDIKTSSYNHQNILKEVQSQEKKFGPYSYILYTTRLESQRITNLEQNVITNFKTPPNLQL